jgi:hypothetical protein
MKELLKALKDWRDKHPVHDREYLDYLKREEEKLKDDIAKSRALIAEERNIGLDEINKRLDLLEVKRELIAILKTKRIEWGGNNR